MLRWLGLGACLVFLLMAAAPSFADTPVQLRARIEASGPALTLGEVFDGAGAAASRAVAPAPPPGQMSNISTQVLQAAAQSAGLTWSPAPGVTSVRVIRPGGMRATLPPSASQGGATTQQISGDIGVRRGETVTLTFRMPGMLLSTRARALEDGAIGQSIRFVNQSSNRTIEAVVTGPGAARADAQ